METMWRPHGDAVLTNAKIVASQKANDLRAIDINGYFRLISCSALISTATGLTSSKLRIAIVVVASIHRMNSGDRFPVAAPDASLVPGGGGGSCRALSLGVAGLRLAVPAF